MSVKHMVLFQFKTETTPGQIQEIMDALGALVGKIPGLSSFEYGPYSGPYPEGEGLAKAYSHGFIMTFRDSASRAAYLPHPEHLKARDLLWPHVADVIAFDFEPRRGA